MKPSAGPADLAAPGGKQALTILLNPVIKLQ